MGNHTVETREAAGMSKTTMCYAGISKGEREEIEINAKGAATRETLPTDYKAIPAYDNSNQRSTQRSTQR